LIINIGQNICVNSKKFGQKSKFVLKKNQNFRQKLFFGQKFSQKPKFSIKIEKKIMKIFENLMAGGKR